MTCTIFFSLGVLLGTQRRFCIGALKGFYRASIGVLGCIRGSIRVRWVVHGTVKVVWCCKRFYQGSVKGFNNSPRPVWVLRTGLIRD